MRRCLSSIGGGGHGASSSLSASSSNGKSRSLGGPKSFGCVSALAKFSDSQSGSGSHGSNVLVRKIERGEWKGVLNRLKTATGGIWEVSACDAGTIVVPVRGGTRGGFGGGGMDGSTSSNSSAATPRRRRRSSLGDIEVEETSAGRRSGSNHNKKRATKRGEESERVMVVRCSPLFLALIARSAPPDVLLALVRAFPEATRRVPSGGCGNLPLHAAVTFSATATAPPASCGDSRVPCGSTSTCLSVVRAILRAYPEAARRSNDRGWLPLHLACSAKPPAVLLHFVNVPYMQPPFRAASSVDQTLLHDLVAIVQLLLETHPEAASQATTGLMNHGWLPLHCAVRTGFVQVLDLLLEYYPAAAQIPAGGATATTTARTLLPTRAGSLPFHMMFYNESTLVSGPPTTSTTTTTTTTTASARHSPRRASGLIQKTYQLLRNAAPLLKAYPQAIFIADPRHGTSPAETAHKRDLFVLHQMLQAAYPSACQDHDQEESLATDTAIHALPAAYQYGASSQVILTMLQWMETAALGVSTCATKDDNDQKKEVVLPLHLACRRLAGWDGASRTTTTTTDHLVFSEAMEPDSILCHFSTEETGTLNPPPPPPPPPLPLTTTSSMLSTASASPSSTSSSSTSLDQEIVRVLVQRYPAALLVPDGKYQLLPLVMLCLSYGGGPSSTTRAAFNVSLDLLYLMLRENPESLRTS